MFERFKNRNRTVDDRRSGAVTSEANTRDRTVRDNGTEIDDTAPRPGNGRTRRSTNVATADTMSKVRARQREEFGGINWGAAFFGWLVAVGVAVLLTGILAAAGAAIGLTQPSTASQAQSDAKTLTLVGAIALLVVLALAYYCGGYVAGRMSRFDGARQGIGSWIIGLLVTIAAAVLAVIAGDKYNVVQQANLPRLPVGQETLTTGGAIATAVILLGTLLFAALGGIAGARYHRKVDRAGFVD
jgi:membrane protease YdiL (CAAX protease family)